jgi:hypothetical protein
LEASTVKAKPEFVTRQLQRYLKVFALGCALWVLTLLPSDVQAQSCLTSGELDDASRTAITSAGQRYFDMASKDDVASLRQNSVSTLASNFSGVEAVVKERHDDLAGAQAAVKSAFLLDASGSAPIQRAEFLCGVFDKNGQTPGSAAFYLDNLPPAKYAVVVLAATSAKASITVSQILQQVGAEWKLGGLYISSALVGGHNSDWFLARAREYKAKGQMHNAWLFYMEARNLISPLPFMYTLATDKLYDESHGLQPSDLPADGKTVDFAAGSASYKLTAVYAAGVGDNLDLIVKYQSADASDNNLAYKDNVALIEAFVAKYPELRDAFAGVVARAEDASGHDYGTLLAMKDIK